MGSSSSISWTANQPSILDSSKLVVLSDPIEDISQEDFFKAMENHIRTRDLTAQLGEVDRKCEDLPDGRGIHETITIQGPQGGKFDLHNIHKIDHENGVAWTDAYFGDASLQEATSHTELKAVKDPSFRLQAYTQDLIEARRSGPIIQGIVKLTLSQMQYDVDVQTDVDSPSEPGKKSVISAELPDADLTLPLFYEKITAVVESTQSVTKLPDGSLVVEQSTATGSLFYKYTLKESEDVLEVLDFQKDETMSEPKNMLFYRVVDGPKRVEAWSTNVPGRRAGEGVKAIVTAIVEAALKAHGESS